MLYNYYIFLLFGYTFGMEYNSLLLETAAVQGLKEDEFVRRGCRVTHGIMPDKGEYYTLTECGDDDNLVRIFASYIKELAGENLKRVLIVGLGNRGMTADALGNEVLSRLTAGGKPHFYLLAPQVSVVTGVESAQIVESLSERLRPDLTVLIDTLSSSRFERLGRCYQLGDFPLMPGSGVGNAKSLSPAGRTISLGVPLVIKLGDLGVQGLKNYVVTPADIHDLVAHCGKMIAAAVNRALAHSK